MKKHTICYSLLVLTIVVLTGQISSSKNGNLKLKEPKAIVVEPDDYKSTKRELNTLKSELEKKDSLISMLNTRIKEKNSEVEQIKKAKLEDIKPKDEEKKNPLLNILSSADKILANPEVKEMRKKHLLSRYASLFKKLNLDENQKDQLVQLLLDRDKQKQQKLIEMLSRNKSGDELNPETFKDLTEKTEADQEIADLLGSDYESFDYYEKTAFERYQLNDISASLSEADKLSVEQEDKLVDLLKKRTDDIIAGNMKSDEEYVTESTEFLNQAQSEEVGKSLKRSKLGDIPFVEGGNIQVIQSIE